MEISNPTPVSSAGMPIERHESSFVVKKQLNVASHLQSASLEDKLSPLQFDRQKVEPLFPSILKSPVSAVEKDSADTSGVGDAEKLRPFFPRTWGQRYVELEANPQATWAQHPPLRVGIVLSGGQAAGGHNVIAGVYDYVKQCNPNSQLIGFIGGPQGIYTYRCMEITDEYMAKFRNQGGFDMIRSGRHKIESEEHKAASLQNCRTLDLNGLVVVGGDDSNTSAAILAEYFIANDSPTRVIGVPKTIDGDLRNEYVEASFGFDTAVKTFSQFIGNLCTDVATSGKYYHFVRVMGRSASHIALECAMQTRPNMVLIGEEVQAKRLTMKEIVEEIVTMVIKRHEMGKSYGVIVVPEGLIEFSIQIGELIRELNEILAAGPFDESKLSPEKQSLFHQLPSMISQELLIDRDPHGNVQVAKIATERLLILMVERRLKELKSTASFKPKSHYFGYEGRCGMPSNFDGNYCYSLGRTAGALVDHKKTGYMAILRHLGKPAEQWVPAGCPLTMMMTMERRKGQDKPVIKKYTVDLEGPLFKMYTAAREEWKYRDVYRSPGPIQFSGPSSDVSNCTIDLPTPSFLVPDKPHNYDELSQRSFFVKSSSQISSLEHQRLSAKLTISPQLTSSRYTLVENRQGGSDADPVSRHAVAQSFPLQVADHKGRICVMGATSAPTVRKEPMRIGIALTGQQAPGVSNILWGLWERLQLHNPPGQVIGFLGGGRGLMSDPPRYIEVTKQDLHLCRNQGGFELLGRDPDSEGSIGTAESVEVIRNTCTSLNLDGLVLIGGRWAMTDVSVIAEHFLTHGVKTRVIGVPATQNNNLDGAHIEATLGFDSASKCYSALIGNLLTDSASATKYWYFIRLMGRDKSQMVLEAALQTHPNLTLVSELYAAGDKTIEDCVSDIADCVVRRAEDGKDFGTVLIPEGLISALPQFRQLVKEVNVLLSQQVKTGHGPGGGTGSLEEQAVYDELVACNIEEKGRYLSRLSPWSLALLNSLPPFFRKQIIQPRLRGRLQLSQIATEELLSQLVQQELAKRHQRGTYRGAFSPVCFYFGYQGRSSLPSRFDCTLGISHGYLSGVCVESNLTGYITSMRGLCGPTNTWRPIAVPVTTIAKLQPDTDVYADDKLPLVASDMVKLDGKPYRKVTCASQLWELEDRYCNPGPMQFTGPASHYYSRYLFEEHHDYLNMLSKVQDSLDYIRAVCGFGVEKNLLRTTSLTLDTLRKILGDESRESPLDEEQVITEDAASPTSMGA